jgi:hypothetical protein
MMPPSKMSELTEDDLQCLRELVNQLTDPFNPENLFMIDIFLVDPENYGIYYVIRYRANYLDNVKVFKRDAIAVDMPQHPASNVLGWVHSHVPQLGILRYLQLDFVNLRREAVALPAGALPSAHLDSLRRKFTKVQHDL